VHTGRARVVRDPTAESIGAGEVLVAAATDAAWSPLFVTAGAIVVERGGPLSHAAIVARELGVPAVLNLPGATRLLDGAVVTVDGDRGEVVVHPPEGFEP
jgi:pyruvate,water dikinase